MILHASEHPSPAGRSETSGNCRRESPFPAWIIRSKIKPADQMSPLIDRPRLIQRLNENLDRKLTLISASAGYGKTALMNCWRRELAGQGIKVAWLSLDEADNPPGMLATYLAFALRGAGLRSAIEEMPPKNFGRRLDPRTVLGMLVSALTTSGKRFVLMLDGFETLKAESTKSVVEPMLRYFPKNIHIVIAGRTSGLLPLSDYRLSGALVELDAEDLKFTFPEMKNFLEPLLDTTQLKQVAKICGGWPVALQFMKIALTNSDDRKSLLRRFKGTREEFRRYFAEQFMKCVPQAQQEFLTDVSILDRIAPESADFIRNRADSRLLANEMEEMRGFLVREQAGERRYRLHPLLRQFLRHHLKLHHPGRYMTLHRRAAVWAARKGHVIRAMKYALEAGDQETAAEIIESAGGITSWYREGMARLRAAHSLLPDDIIARRPRLLLIRALVLLKDGQLTDAREILEQVRSQNASSSDARLHYEIAVLAYAASLYECSDPAACIPELKATLDSLGEGREAERPYLYTTLCASGLQNGRFSEAAKAAQAGIAIGRPFESAYLYLHLGAMNLAQGRFRAAAAKYRKGQAIIRRDFKNDKDIRLVANVLMAEWHFERNDLSRARNLLGDANTRLVHGEAWYEIYAAGYTTSSAIAYELHGLEDAARETEGALEYVRKEGLKRLRRLLAANRCGYLTRSGKIGRARTLIQENGLSLDDYKDPSNGNPVIRERLGVVPSLCRLLIAEKRYKKALGELSGFIAIEREIGHRRAILKYSLLLSLALHLARKRRDSFEILNEALGTVRREGLVRPVLDEAPFITELLEAYVNSRYATESDHAAHLLNLLADGAADHHETKLSKRERQVLEELSKGLSDKAIARNLGVTEHTIRFHLKNIFRKFGVNNRLQAVTAASALLTELSY